MQISSVNVKNFKSIKDQTFDGFTHVNMFFGQNNSGKSNALKFLNLFFQKKIPKSGSSITIDTSRSDLADLGNPQAEPLNFWEGIIPNEPYIFHKNNRNIDIEFKVEIKIDIDDLGGVKNASDVVTQYFGGKNHAIVSLSGVITARGSYDAEMVTHLTSLNGREIFLEKNGYFSSAKGKGAKLLQSNGYEIYNGLLGALI
jgi:predicted ATP-dependent endonuclease of OLD family